MCKTKIWKTKTLVPRFLLECDRVFVLGTSFLTPLRGCVKTKMSKTRMEEPTKVFGLRFYVFVFNTPAPTLGRSPKWEVTVQPSGHVWWVCNVMALRSRPAKKNNYQWRMILAQGERSDNCITMLFTSTPIRCGMYSNYPKHPYMFLTWISPTMDKLTYTLELWEKRCCFTMFSI